MKRIKNNDIAKSVNIQNLFATTVISIHRLVPKKEHFP